MHLWSFFGLEKRRPGSSQPGTIGAYLVVAAAAAAFFFAVLSGGLPLSFLFLLFLQHLISFSARVFRCNCIACLSVRQSSYAQGVKDWEAVLQKARGMFLKCPPGELIRRAPAYMKETLEAGG